MAQMREEMRSLIKVGGNEVKATPSSSLVDLASSPQAFSSSSSSESSLTTTPLVTTQQTSGVTAQEIVVQPNLVKTSNVKVEKKSGNNNLFVILTWILTCLLLFQKWRSRASPFWTSLGFILLLQCMFLIFNHTQRESNWWSPKMSAVEYWPCKECFKC